MTFWLIEYTAESPALWIAAAGGLTYQRHRAKRFESRLLAEMALQGMQLAETWQVIAHTDWLPEKTRPDRPGSTNSDPLSGVSPPKTPR